MRMLFCDATDRETVCAIVVVAGVHNAVIEVQTVTVVATISSTAPVICESTCVVQRTIAADTVAYGGKEKGSLAITKNPTVNTV